MKILKIWKEKKMKFEDIIKFISGTLAFLIIFFVAGGFYLSLKGFESDGKGGFVLVQDVNAQNQSAIAKTLKASTAKNEIDLPILGSEKAPITIYEHSSYGCSHCADFHLYTLPKLKEKYIDSGLVKVIFIDFPLDQKSMQASLISHCVEDKDYFEFANLLFKNQGDWGYSFNSEKKFIQYASLFGLTKEQAQECLKNKDTNMDIISRRGIAMSKYDIKGTPVFAIEDATDVEVIHGAPDLKTLESILDKKIAKSTNR